MNNSYEYKFFNGMYRYNYYALALKNNWKHISFHYANDKTNTFFNWHFAYRFKWPFLIIGFNNVCKLI